MSLLTLAERSLVEVEVEGSRGDDGLAFLDDHLRLASLELGDLVLQGSVLGLESGNLGLEGVVLLGRERNRNDHRGNGGVTAEAGLAEVEDQTSGSGERHVETAVTLILSFFGQEDIQVNEQIYTTTQTEVIEDTGATDPLVVFVSDKTTEGSIRDNIPETGLLVARESVRDVPKSVSVNILLGEFAHLLSLVLQTFPTHASTNARGEPLTDETVDSQAVTIKLDQVRNSAVDTGTDTDKPVVAEFVGFIGTTDNLAVFVAVTILLRIGAEGEAQETCYCKCTKNSFNTFHFFYK